MGINVASGPISGTIGSNPTDARTQLGFWISPALVERWSQTIAQPGWLASLAALTPVTPNTVTPNTVTPNTRGNNMAVDWGSIFQSGAQALGGYLNMRSRERIARRTGRDPGMMPFDYNTAGSGGYYGDDGITLPPQGRGYPGGQWPQPTTGYPYQTTGYIVPSPGAGPNTAGLLPALVPGAIAAVGVMRRLVPALVRWVGPAAAVEAAQALIAQGFGGDGKKPVYANEKDNITVGIMRGDIKAIRRVKRTSARLMRVMRSAGVGGHRRSRPAARRRAYRPRARIASYSPTIPAHLH